MLSSVIVLWKLAKPTGGGEPAVSPSFCFTGEYAYGTGITGADGFSIQLEKYYPLPFNTIKAKKEEDAAYKSKYLPLFYV